MEMEDSKRQKDENSVQERDESSVDEESKSEICLKTHKQGKETLIAVCDSEILGKEFREGGLHVDVCIDFFGEERSSLSEFEAALRFATMANFVGCKAVGHAIRLGYVDEENVLSIDGVLYAQMVRM